MIVWGNGPIRFFALFTIIGVFGGYGLFSIILGVPEGIAIGLGMIIIWPVTTYFEYRWRKKAGYRMTNNKVASICSIPTWIFTGITSVVFTLLFIIVELQK